jgi:hypothetical protein
MKDFSFRDYLKLQRVSLPWSMGLSEDHKMIEITFGYDLQHIWKAG